MLTADLVRAYVRSGELRISQWKGDARERAQRLAESYVLIAADSVGQTRGDITEAFDDVPVGARDRKLALGLRKLVLDRCEFEVEAALDPPALRAEVFALAAEQRAEAEDLAAFSRDAVLEAVAARHEMPAPEIERLLFADLKSAHRLLRVDEVAPDALLHHYEDSQVQAVLLRAERVVAEVECASPAAYRALFRKLKFHRLLYTIDTRARGGYRIEIDGPFSLFGSSTKYGLQLAMLVPALRGCDRWSLEATVRWGKDRKRVRFAAEGARDPRGAEESADLPEEVATLLGKLRERHAKGKSAWAPEICGELLNLPGVGVCVPDLVFVRDKARVYFEVLGFWSREAVWRRVELVEKGLETPVLFAVPKRLRVSEEVLPEDLPSALYVYKGVLSMKAIEDRLELLGSRGAP